MLGKVTQRRDLHRTLPRVVVMGLLFFGAFGLAFGQVDQGAITGTVEDPAGAVVVNAQMTVTSTDTGLVLHGKTDGRGVYVFSPLKIGHYTVTASAPGFQTTTQSNLTLHQEERLNLTITLKPGEVSESVVVNTEPPLLETESSTIGQVLDPTTINNVPLNGRNWVYIAQLAAGVTPSLGQSQGGGSGDFIANGQRASQNNFILNGMDNNAVVDGAGQSYTQLPPPDALAEFSVSTSNYNAEYGFSAGAVVNASIRSGTNKLHGSVWDYIRNTAFDARDWDSTEVPPYHENQFGATLGFPILRNKLFYFGDAQANLVSYANAQTLTVATARERQGDFSELLNPNLTGAGSPIQLYQPNSGGTQTLSCNGQNNVYCPGQIDSVAQTLINLEPLPNTNDGSLVNNYLVNLKTSLHNWNWNQRLDWNISEKDRAYTTLGYNNTIYVAPPPLGNVLDGGSAVNNNLLESIMLTETHVFSPTLTNEVRVGYNWAGFSNLAINANVDVAAKYGVAMPFGPNYPDNGGLPDIDPGLNGTHIGTGDYEPNVQRQNMLQIQDNLSKALGQHSLKFGVNLQPMRIYLEQPPHGRGSYYYHGLYTSNLGASYTGYGLADFMANQMQQAYVSPNVPVDYYRWYRAAYVQDDWHVRRNLTLNLGLRYDYFQPISQQNYGISNLICNDCSGVGTGSATLYVPSALTKLYGTLPQAYFTLLQQSNINVKFEDSHSLSNTQKSNFAPRIGFSFQPDSKTVLNGGFGIFYGGAEAFSGLELGLNYPFEFTDTFVAPNCAPNDCPSIGVTLEQGFYGPSGNGLINFINQPGFDGLDRNQKTPYTESYSLTVQRSLGADTVASVGYVGNGSRHLGTLLSPNDSNALQNPANNGSAASPFPLLGPINFVSMSGYSNYNSLQAKLERRMENGLNFLATYTWAHAMDDSVSPSGIEAGTQDRNTNLIPIKYEYTNSAFDVRHRVTANVYYELPFGMHRKFLNRHGVAEEVAGGWAADLSFAAQTGVPFTVHPDISTASQFGATNANANLIRDPFKGGGTPDPSNPGVSCPEHVHNRTNWYNPCAFGNPLDGSTIPMSGPGSMVTGTANAIKYLGGVSNQIHGPGYARANMSLFKDFTTIREQYLEFRADIFNLTNTPSLGNPGTNDDSSFGGQITGPKYFQTLTPDARFFQLSLKYAF